MHEVLPQGLQSAQEAEETVSVRVLGFLPPLLFRRPSRRSFDHATRYARVRRRDPCHVRKRLRDAPYFRLDTITGSEYVPHLYIHLPLRDTLRETFFSRSARDAAARDAVTFSTLRLPLAGHVSLAKNAHLPCLAVAQTLMVFRRVHRSTEKERGKEKESRRGPTASGDVARRRDAEPGRAPWPEKEGGANASVWGETLARCPAFRCAPLRKYVRWAPPYEALNEKEGEVKPSSVTDVDALF